MKLLCLLAASFGTAAVVFRRRGDSLVDLPPSLAARSGSSGNTDVESDPCAGLKKIKAPSGGIFCVQNGVELPTAVSLPLDTPAITIFMRVEGLAYDHLMLPSHEAAREELGVLVRRGVFELVAPMLKNAKATPTSFLEKERQPGGSGESDMSGSGSSSAGSDASAPAGSFSKSAADAEVLKNDLDGSLRVFVEWTSAPEYPPVAALVVNVVGKEITKDNAELLAKEFASHKKFYVKNWQGHISFLLGQSHVVNWQDGSRVKIMGSVATKDYRNFVSDCRSKVNRDVNLWESHMPQNEIPHVLENSCDEFNAIFSFDRPGEPHDHSTRSEKDQRRCKRFSKFVVEHVLGVADPVQKAEQLTTGCRQLCKRMFGRRDIRCQNPKPMVDPPKEKMAAEDEKTFAAQTAAAEDADDELLDEEDEEDAGAPRQLEEITQADDGTGSSPDPYTVT